MNADVLKPGALRARLGLGRGRFNELQQLGRFRHLENRTVSAAVGARVYSRAKVDAFFEERLIVAARKRA